MAEGIGRLVLKYAGARNLARITVFTSSGLGTAWNFFGVDVKNGATTPVAIPTLPGARVEAFFAGFSAGVLGGEPAFTPAVMNVAPQDDLRLLTNRDRASSASAAERQRALEAAARLEEPTLHSSGTIDCVSCHIAETVRAFGGEVNVHMLGYQRDVASIQRRTIREVEVTVAFLNGHRR
jgi:hypothetical protein